MRHFLILPKLMKSKLAKLIQIRCVQLSSPKMVQKLLAFFVNVVLQPRCQRGQHTQSFFAAAGPSDNSAFRAAPLAEHRPGGWLCRYITTPSELPPAPGSGSEPRQTCHGQGLQEAVALLTPLI